MIDHQFYPTPLSLAEKAWSLFTNKSVRHLLEPSAGRADLLEVCRFDNYSKNYRYNIDCIEAMPDNIAVLKSKGLKVVDTDFLSFSTKKLYDRVFLNPPYSNGISHALKAWDILKNGEMVAILNAATIENPNSADKRFLVSLIEEHGSVEFVDSAFTTEDTQRKTEVRVALVHLVKVTHEEAMFYLDDVSFTKDRAKQQHENSEADDLYHQELCIPNSTIENSVVAFNAAADALKTSIKAYAKANYYRSIVGGASNRRPKDFSNSRSIQDFNDQYDELKLAAWSNVIRATEFTQRFSKKVVEGLENELESIKEMEFTVRNIHGLLEGLLLNKSQLDDQMLLDTFDSITSFHSENRFVYRSFVQSGWKSNDRHKTRSFRMKHTRFILPAHSGCYDSFGWDGLRTLADFDKTFALLDGKQKPLLGMEAMFQDKACFEALKDGERLFSSYFSCRFYRGKDSIHFFPTKKGKELIERFNRVVGKLRNWLPDENTVSPEFWEQYDRAEEITKELEKDANYTQLRDYEFQHGSAELEPFHDKACESLNIPLFSRLESTSNSMQLSLLDDAA